MKMHTCPGCGATKAEEDWDIDIKDIGRRETIFGFAHVNSCGFLCRDCGAIWGHEA